MSVIHQPNPKVPNHSMIQKDAAYQGDHVVKNLTKYFKQVKTGKRGRGGRNWKNISNKSKPGNGVRGWGVVGGVGGRLLGVGPGG